MSRRSNESQSENWITDVRRRLAERREKKPETKAGQIWALWPEIKAALADGQTIKSIRLWLDEEGAWSSLLTAFDRIFADVAERRLGAEKQIRLLPPSQSSVNQIHQRFRFSLRCRSPLYCR